MTTNLQATTILCQHWHGILGNVVLYHNRLNAIEIELEDVRRTFGFNKGMKYSIGDVSTVSIPIKKPTSFSKELGFLATASITFNWRSPFRRIIWSVSGHV